MAENEESVVERLNSFGDEMPDGRLTVPSDKIYRLHDAIAYKEQVGRTLTAEEMAQFEVKPEKKRRKLINFLRAKSEEEKTR